MQKSKQMTEGRLEAIKARAEAATPGPWVDRLRDFEGADGYGLESHPTVEANGKTVCIFCEREIDDDNDEVNAEFIAAAREDVPALLEEVERLQRVARYLATKLSTLNASRKKFVGASLDDGYGQALFNDKECAVQSWIDEAEREVSNEQ